MMPTTVNVLFHQGMLVVLLCPYCVYYHIEVSHCVALTLQQADWFKDLVRRELIGGGIEDLAKDAVQDIVESEVESYFENSFDPSYHFDFDDAVHDAVGDKIDEAVDSYLSNATISITK